MFANDYRELIEAWEKEHPFLLIEKIVATYDGLLVYTTVSGKTFRWDRKAKKFIEVQDWRKHNA